MLAPQDTFDAALQQLQALSATLDRGNAALVAELGIAAAAVAPARAALDAAVASQAEAQRKKTELEKEHAELEAAVHSTTCEAYLAARHSSLSREEAAALRQEVEDAYSNGFAGLGCVPVV